MYIAGFGSSFGSTTGFFVPPMNRMISNGSSPGMSERVSTGSNDIMSDVLYFFRLLMG